MRPRNRTLKLVEMPLPLFFVVFFGTLLSQLFAQQSGQTTFASPEEAGHALFSAAQSNDENALVTILGPADRLVALSGDAEEDVQARKQFVSKYTQMHRYAKKGDGKLILVIGAENWPFPVPLIQGTAGWYFDTATGKDEIVFRRVGRNEIAAILACGELVDAEKQYFAGTSGSAKQYAQKLLSDTGKRDGLYWQQTPGAPVNSFNPLIAHATENGADKSTSTPFYGYFFRVLTQQGADAPGGASNYLDGDKMTKGFAFVAYPAEYRSSGVKTFIVNQDGVLYEKDLGPDGKELARTMTAYNPDASWKRVD